ncbi:MAG: bifunctional folylpolyglutamate synthase/dihydrofolate synthase [Candidatus Bipolaricaulia bacterium]
MRPFHSFADAYRYIVQFTNYERMTDLHYTRDAFDLERVREILSALGNPEEQLKIIHIAGTKGKGSVAHMTASILREAGYRVGLFTKPHLIRLNERISIDGNDISDGVFTEMMNDLYPHMERLRLGGNPLTFFDIITVLALTTFARSKVDFTVLEVGLGGRLDSTNVVSPVVTAITSISYDHTELLGDTLSEIATEKAGIIKTGVPMIVGTEDPETTAVIRAVAESKEAPLFQIGEVFRVISHGDDSNFTVETWQMDYRNLSTSLLGVHQHNNAAVAVAIIEVLSMTQSARISEDQIADGLANVNAPGRIEVILKTPMIILDVAHNPASMAALRAVLQDLSRGKERVVLLYGMSREKDIKGCLEIILPVADVALFTTTGNPRSADPDGMADIARELGFSNIQVESDIEKAFINASSMTRTEDLLCITGSFYLAGVIASLYEENAILL